MVSLYCQQIFFVFFIFKFKLNTTPVNTTIIIIKRQVSPTAQKNHALDDIRMYDTLVFRFSSFTGWIFCMQKICCTYSHWSKAREQVMSSSKQEEQLWQSCEYKQVMEGQSDCCGILPPRTQFLQHYMPDYEVRLKQYMLYCAYLSFLSPYCCMLLVMLISDEDRYQSATVVNEPQIPILELGLIVIWSCSQQVKFYAS